MLGEDEDFLYYQAEGKNRTVYGLLGKKYITSVERHSQSDTLRDYDNIIFLFDTKVRYDQSGIVMYLDSENWLKAAMEYENEEIQRLGSVVTNNGYSDWSSVDVDASIKSIWFRLSRRENDFCIENSTDGINFKQMRICHMFNVKDTIRFGIYACSAEDSSFKALFTDMEVIECKWLPHDGQAPDEE